ncbi:MAG: HAMP domain-containing histidine kinase [Bacteroidales bacterium]|nr:HAMP domain-containing histidine kinase [Bacteroidales bacterium]
MPENIIFQLTIFNISLSIFVFTIISLGYNQIIDLIESELKNRQNKLEELNKAKDKFFSLISHDLKSPISTLVGLSDLMTERFSTYNSEKQLKFLKQINSSHKDMYKLVTNLLDWSRTQQGKIVTFYIDFNIAKIIEETISLIQNSADEKRITFRILQSKNHIVNADIQMIKTVLRNLITNAVKFSYPGSVIDISTYKEGETLHVKITDYGIGIAKEHIDQIFSIDRTLSSKGTNNEQGTGLGLIICKEFIEKNKGSIWVESSIQKGSTFSFSLPLSKSQTEADSVS